MLNPTEHEIQAGTVIYLACKCQVHVGKSDPNVIKNLTAGEHETNMLLTVGFRIKVT